MIEIGRYNDLRFINKTPVGLILTDGGQEVLLPFIHAPEEVEIGDTLHVFVFTHSDGRLFATTQAPLALAEEFSFLEVVDQNELGSFVSIGIDKDVFVPEREQKRPMRLGQKYVVYVYVEDGRLVASSRLNDFVDQDGFDFEVGDEVSLIISDHTDLGYNAIINKKFIGLLYENEVFEKLESGDIRRGFVKKIRDGNLIDLSLQVIGFGHILDLKDSLLLQLEENNGLITLGDKSSPEEIYRRLKISKKAFKKTIGSLYKERLIMISDYEIKRVKLVIPQDPEF